MYYMTSEKPHSKKGGVVGKLSWRVDKLLSWGFATLAYDNKSVNQNGIVSAHFNFFLKLAVVDLRTEKFFDFPSLILKSNSNWKAIYFVSMIYPVVHVEIDLRTPNKEFRFLM